MFLTLLTGGQLCPVYVCIAFFTVPGCLLCRHCLILTELKLSQWSFPHHSRLRWWNEVDFVTGCVIKGFTIFSATSITSMLVTACQIKVGSESSTYCVPKSSAGGWKCKGLPFSREYGEELVGRRKKKKLNTNATYLNLISFTKNLNMRRNTSMFICFTNNLWQEHCVPIPMKGDKMSGRSWITI